MLKYEQELRQKSQLGDENSQIILLFKLMFEYDDESQSRKLLHQLQNRDSLFKGMRNYAFYEYKRAFEIFNSVCSLKKDTLKTYYAWFMIGRCYYLGRGVEQDILIGIKWYKKAAKKGHDLANYYLGYHYRNIRQYEKAILAFEQSAKCYNRLAIIELADIYTTSVLSKNLLKAYDYLLILYQPDSHCLDLMAIIMNTANINWDFKNHQYWSNLEWTINTTKFNKSVCLKSVKFTHQVFILMLISKYRHVSNSSYILIFNKFIAVSVIRQLAKIW